MGSGLQSASAEFDIFHVFIQLTFAEPYTKLEVKVSTKLKPWINNTLLEMINIYIYKTKNI